MEKIPFEQPSISLDRSGEPLPGGNANRQEQAAMEKIADFECPLHEGEKTVTQVAIGGEVIYSCRTTGKRVSNQDAIE